MPDYQVGYTKHSFRDVLAIAAPHQSRIRKAVDSLAFNPRPAGCTKLAGYETMYRIRVGKYRIAYVVNDKASTVLVTTVGVRNSFYEELKRRRGYM